MKSKSLSSRNRSSLGRSCRLFPAIGRISPSFQEPHLEEEHEVGNEWGVGFCKSGRGSEVFPDSPVHPLSILHLLLPLFLKQVLGVISHGPSWGRGEQGSGLPWTTPFGPLCLTFSSVSPFNFSPLPHLSHLLYIITSPPGPLLPPAAPPSPAPHQCPPAGR